MLGLSAVNGSTINLKRRLPYVPIALVFMLSPPKLSPGLGYALER